MLFLHATAASNVPFRGAAYGAASLTVPFVDVPTRNNGTTLRIRNGWARGTTRIVLAKESNADAFVSAYLTVNALSPVCVVYVCLYELHSIVAAIFVFHALCLVTMPALLVSLDPRCGRTLEWYKTHVQQQLVPENWRAQLPFAGKHAIKHVSMFC